MTDEKNIRKEEVDLGALFSLLGSAITRVFDFFKGLFVSLFNFSISILLFIRKHIIKIAVVLIIGFIIGYIQDKAKAKQFQDNMIVQANFGAVRQLYQDIQYYDNLVSQEDTNKLSSIFNVSIIEAKSLKSFRIFPEPANFNLLNSFNEFKLELDSLVSENYTLDIYKKQAANTDYIFHKIQVEAEDAQIFSKLTLPIINSIESNTRFIERRNLNRERITTKTMFLSSSLDAVDSLRLVYNELLINNSDNKKSNDGTIINLAQTDQNSAELDLFNTEIRIYKKLEHLQIEQIENSMDIINVLSNFQYLGAEISDFSKKSYLRYPFIGLFILLIFIGLNSLNQYLNKYSKS